MAAEKNYAFPMIAIVAIVAIVGLVILFMQNGTAIRYATTGAEAQQAISMPTKESNMITETYTAEEWEKIGPELMKKSGNLAGAANAYGNCRSLYVTWQPGSFLGDEGSSVCCYKGTSKTFAWCIDF